MIYIMSDAKISGRVIKMIAELKEPCVTRVEDVVGTFTLSDDRKGVIKIVLSTEEDYEF